LRWWLASDLGSWQFSFAASVQKLHGTGFSSRRTNHTYICKNHLTNGYPYCSAHGSRIDAPELVCKNKVSTERYLIKPKAPVLVAISLRGIAACRAINGDCDPSFVKHMADKKTLGTHLEETADANRSHQGVQNLLCPDSKEGILLLYDHHA
jgi:hypothetical protein